MMDSERGSCRWNWHIWSLWLIYWKVFREKFLCSAFRKCFTHEWLQVKTENHFCFLLTVPASHPCQILICCVAAPSVKRLGMIIDLHKKCMTLFVSCRTRHFQTFLFPFVWTLFVAWVTKICFDSCGNCFFRICFYRADGVNHIILYLQDGTFKVKNSERTTEKSACRLFVGAMTLWLIFTRKSLTSSVHRFALMYCWVFTVRRAYKRTLTN